MSDKSPAEVRKDMWKKMSSSPFVMLKLDASKAHAEPMTAQLDPDADSEFWFYCKRDNRAAEGGPAMVQFVGKGHDIFACIAGTLTEETREDIKDKYWNKQAEAWFPEGRQDPQLMMLRFELADAEIWEADLSLTGKFKLLTGQTIKAGESGSHAKINV